MFLQEVPGVSHTWSSVNFSVSFIMAGLSCVDCGVVPTIIHAVDKPAQIGLPLIQHAKFGSTESMNELPHGLPRDIWGHVGAFRRVEVVGYTGGCTLWPDLVSPHSHEFALHCHVAQPYEQSNPLALRPRIDIFWGTRCDTARQKCCALCGKVGSRPDLTSEPFAHPFLSFSSPERGNGLAFIAATSSGVSSGRGR
jgi:hypothetical protein